MAPEQGMDYYIVILNIENGICTGDYRTYVFKEALEAIFQFLPEEIDRNKYLDRAIGTLLIDLNNKDLNELIEKMAGPHIIDSSLIVPVKIQGKDAFIFKSPRLTPTDIPFIFHVVLPANSWCTKNCILKKSEGEGIAHHEEDVSIVTHKKLNRQSITWVCNKHNKKDPNRMTLTLGVTFFKPDENEFNKIQKRVENVNEEEKVTEFVVDQYNN